MNEMTVLEALNAAMAHELERDPDVVILGEDVGIAVPTSRLAAVRPVAGTCPRRHGVLHVRRGPVQERSGEVAQPCLLILPGNI